MQIFCDSKRAIVQDDSTRGFGVIRTPAIRQGNKVAPSIASRIVHRIRDAVVSK